MRKLHAILAALPLAASAADVTIHVDQNDPHAIIPAEPGASLVAAEDGTLRVETRADALAASDVPPATGTAPAPGDPAAPGQTTISTPGQTTVTTPGETTVVVEPGGEARTSLGAPPTTRSPSQMQERVTVLRDRRDPLNTITIAPKAYADLDRLDGLRRDDVGGALGIQLDRALARPLSLVAGVDLGMRDRGPGLSDDTLVGLAAGLNLFAIGGNNEGLYLGPRVNWAATGHDDAISEGDRFGYGGEVGLRFVSSGGFTGGVAAGVMNMTRGAVALDRGPGARAEPVTNRDNFGYGAVQLGWSW